MFSKGPRPINLIYVKIRECAQVTLQLLFLKMRELKETGICFFFLLNVPVHLFILPLISFPLYVCFFHHFHPAMISLHLILRVCVEAYTAFAGDLFSLGDGLLRPACSCHRKCLLMVFRAEKCPVHHKY